MAQNSMVLNYIGPIDDNNLPTIIPVGSMAYFNDALGNNIRIYDGTKWLPMQTVNDDLMPIKELVCDTVKFGSSVFHTVEPRGYDWDTVYDWTTETFGKPRTGPGQPECKWFVSEGSLYFHEEKHRDWLVLRWSGNENSQTLDIK